MYLNHFSTNSNDDFLMFSRYIDLGQLLIDNNRLTHIMFIVYLYFSLIMYKTSNDVIAMLIECWKVIQPLFLTSWLPGFARASPSLLLPPHLLLLSSLPPSDYPASPRIFAV